MLSLRHRHGSTMFSRAAFKSASPLSSSTALDGRNPRVSQRCYVYPAQSKGLFPNPPSVEGKLGEKYAVIEIGGGQQIVEEGRHYSCHRLNVPVGSLVKLPRVVAAKHEGDLKVGEPYLEDVTVEAEILEDYRGPKITVLKYRPKKNYRKVRGHRQEMTRFRVTKIEKA